MAALRHIHPWPRRLRWRLVLGFVLTVALLQAALTGTERVLLQHALLDAITTSMEAAVRTNLADQLFAQPKAIDAMLAGEKARLGTAPGTPATDPGVKDRLGKLAMATLVVQQLPTLVTALALPDQPVAMLDASGRVLASAPNLTGTDKARAHAPARAALTSILATVTAHLSTLPRQQPVQVATPDGPYLLLLWPAEQPVLTKEQIGVAVKMLKFDTTAPDAALRAALRRLHPSSLLVLMAHRLAPTEQTVQTVTAISLGGSLAVIALATLLGLLVVGRALRPLAAITHGAEQLAQGDYNYRLALDTGGDEVGRLAAAFDRMAAEIATAFATQRRFVADASHELRTPLTALRGYTDVLLLGAAEDWTTAERVLYAMQEDLGRMSRLVDDLLTLARLDGGAALEVRPLVLAELLDAAAHEARAIARGRQHICDAAAPRELLVWGDGDRLRQVLSNVVGNACAYCPAGSTISLHAAAHERWATIIVRDDGPGIPPDDLVRLGERFYRGDAARSRSTGGTGLGLAIARAIVEAHGGRLSIESTLGQGTSVTVALPLAPGTSISASPPASESIAVRS